ncbi:hypothetical protein [Methylocystis sp. S23]|jgi:hypothetical protein
MTDATTEAHRHAHDHAVGRAHDRILIPRPIAPVPASLMESSAAARLLKVSILLAALWAGVYWALH